MGSISGYETEELRTRAVNRMLKTRARVEKTGDKARLQEIDRRLALFGYVAEGKPKRSAKAADTTEAKKPAAKKSTAKKAPAAKATAEDAPAASEPAAAETEAAG